MSGKGTDQVMIQEPGDLPVAVDLSCGRGVPYDRGFPRVATINFGLRMWELHRRLYAWPF